MKANTKPFPLFLLFILVLVAVDCKPDPPIDPCDLVACQNAGVCYDSNCICNGPYLGEFCEITFADAVVGTYIDFSELYYISIEKLSSAQIAVHNLNNTGLTFTGTLSNQNEFVLETLTSVDYEGCAGDIVEHGGSVKARSTSEIELGYYYYLENCDGRFVGSSRGIRGILEKISEDVCKRSFLEDDCNSNLQNKLIGTYSLLEDPSRGFSSTTEPHQIQLSPLEGTVTVAIKNLMRSNSTVVVDIADYNHLEFTQADLPIRMTSDQGTVIVTDDRYMRGYVTPNGKYLIFETTLYGTQGGISVGAFLVYEKN